MTSQCRRYIVNCFVTSRMWHLAINVHYLKWCHQQQKGASNFDKILYEITIKTAKTNEHFILKLLIPVRLVLSPQYSSQVFLSTKNVVMFLKALAFYMISWLFVSNSSSHLCKINLLCTGNYVKFALSYVQDCECRVHLCTKYLSSEYTCMWFTCNFCVLQNLFVGSTACR